MLYVDKQNKNITDTISHQLNLCVSRISPSLLSKFSPEIMNILGRDYDISKWLWLATIGYLSQCPAFLCKNLLYSLSKGWFTLYRHVSVLSFWRWSSIMWTVNWYHRRSITDTSGKFATVKLSQCFAEHRRPPCKCEPLWWW